MSFFQASLLAFFLNAASLPLFAHAQIQNQTYLLQLVNSGATLTFQRAIPHQHISEGNDQVYRYVYIERTTGALGGATVRMNNFPSANPPSTIPAGTRFRLKAQPRGVIFESSARVFGATDALDLEFEEVRLPSGKIISGLRFQILGGRRHRAAAMTVGDLQAIFGNVFTIR